MAVEHGGRSSRSLSQSNRLFSVSSPAHHVGPLYPQPSNSFGFQLYTMNAKFTKSVYCITRCLLTNCLYRHLRSPSKPSRFEQLLASADLPKPGPELYAARRRLWLKAAPERTPKPSKSHTQTRQKLDVLLSNGDLAKDDQAWKKVEKVWKNLHGGSRLSEPVAMGTIVRAFQRPLLHICCLLAQVRIIYAAWRRDGTWPEGYVAPEPDDALPPELEDMPSGGTTSALQSDPCKG